MQLAFVWHFHQPVYRSPEDGSFVLPWVGYHGVKNYDQMARLIAEAGVPATVNFVPCLLDQIEEYAAGRARDPWLEALAKPADRLTGEDLLRLRLITPGECDAAAFQKRARRAYLSPLAGPDAEGDGFAEFARKTLAGLIPAYRRLRSERLVEIITSPYYHPLLPLLYDSHIPADGSPLPALRFRRPEDGAAQLAKAYRYYQGLFGAPPRGLWPPEGGVSREAMADAARAGFSFALTDENVLWKSLPQPHQPRDLYRPYSSEGLTLIFRDRELADLIGFEYQRWRADEAAAHFVERLRDKRREAGDDGLCAVVLDGENPWGCYPENGVPFLRELFRRLKAEPGLRLTFIEDALAGLAPARELELVPGTWLGNFSQWVGHAAKNEAWDRLARARETCGFSDDMAVAEGSDWFWWYGEPGREDFDALFRGYLRRACRPAGGEALP
jgi:alpha-amylase/alpha-mannosidase (GH57 family)